MADAAASPQGRRVRRLEPEAQRDGTGLGRKGRLRLGARPIVRRGPPDEPCLGDRYGRLPPRAGVPDVRDSDSRGRRALSRGPPGADQRAVVTVQPGGCEKSIRVDPTGPHPRGDPHAGHEEPDDRPPVHQVHELQQRRRPGRGNHHVLGRARPIARDPRGPLGVPAQRHRLPRAQVHLEPLDIRRDPRSCARRQVGPRDGGAHHRRHRHRRPVLLLPLCRSARRTVPRPVDRPAAHPHRRTVIRRWAVEQLCHALDCDRGGRTANHRRNDGPRVGERWVRDKARVRCLCHHATCRRPLPVRLSPRRDRCHAAAIARHWGRRRGNRDGRGLLRHARPRRQARTGARLHADA